ncbi:DUF2163 domain-containing protein [Flexibacterium corallicola]|uniref:DUF2163 domain-containing protein n=1 Tax=Flexibacterium corallicola TaxID=3037259 RepID=UPI00286EC715|nr:DUF2163 domain-containing protein [Pseudovibrio sp. M1P-2-3]
MDQIPDALASHLAGDVLTLAHCWLFTRSDGQALGFTDHDCVLVIGSQTYAPAFGLEGTAVQHDAALSVGTQDVRGILSSQSLHEADLQAGLWDGAQVEVYLVNWQAPDVQHVLIRRASIGEVCRQGEVFTCELRSLTHLFGEEKGRVFSKTCSADLGDGVCTVNLEDPRFCAEGTLSAVESSGALVVSLAKDFSKDWFSGGLVEIISGEQAGYKLQVSAHTSGGDGLHRFHLWSSRTPLQAGVLVKVFTGCDKSFGTCSGKFDNAVNFQGFPHMPGNDFALFGPERTSGKNNGGKLVG